MILYIENGKWLRLYIALQFASYSPIAPHTLTRREQRATVQSAGLTIRNSLVFSAQGHLDRWTGGAGD